MNKNKRHIDSVAMIIKEMKDTHDEPFQAYEVYDVLKNDMAMAYKKI